MKNGFAILSLAIVLSIAGVAAALPSPALAAQAESSVSCVEQAAAIHISYGDSASCAIESPTDLDQFSFAGVAGEHIRINSLSLSGNLDPALELRDPNFQLIDSASCMNNGCSYSRDVILPKTGLYFIFMSDVGTNEAGNYLLEVDRIEPTQASVPMDFVSSQSDSIGPQSDIDHFTFHGTAGTEIRLNVLSLSGNLDPTVEIRDPNGSVVINGVADGASCNNNGCSFSVTLPVLTLSGTYSLILYDANVNESGNYALSLWCVFGSCDSDGDGIVDGDAPSLMYDFDQTHAISPQVDGDFYIFGGTAGDLLRLSVLSVSGNLDPTVEIRDPEGTVVTDGAADGASCNNNGCSFSINLPPLTKSGTYSLLLYDMTTNEAGSYVIGIQCLFGACVNATPVCGDNCIAVSNGPLTPGISLANIQRDTDGDGYGNVCDTDINVPNDETTNSLDISVLRAQFGTVGPDADFNGDGVVNGLDVAVARRYFGLAPGPSCPQRP